MKKLKYILILATFFIGLSLHAQVNVHLKQPPPNQLGVGDMWNLELTNTTDKDIKIYLTGTATEEKDGLIIEGKSKVFTLKPGRSNYKYNDFSSAEVKYNNGKYKEIILRTGNAPEGSYTICVTAFDENGIEVGRENCIMQSVQQMGSITLLSPADGEEIDPEQPIIFSWTPLKDAKEYTLKIVEIRGDQSPEVAMTQNKPFFENEGIKTSSFQFPLSKKKFESERRYAWVVVSKEIISDLAIFVQKADEIENTAKCGESAVRTINGSKIIESFDFTYSGNTYESGGDYRLQIDQTYYSNFGFMKLSILFRLFKKNQNGDYNYLANFNSISGFQLKIDRLHAWVKPKCKDCEEKWISETIVDRYAGSLTQGIIGDVTLYYKWTNLSNYYGQLQVSIKPDNNYQWQKSPVYSFKDSRMEHYGNIGSCGELGDWTTPPPTSSAISTFKINNNSSELTTICLNEPIKLNGAGSVSESNVYHVILHNSDAYLSELSIIGEAHLNELDQEWADNNNCTASDLLNGTFDLKNFASKFDHTLQPNQYYKIKVAARFPYTLSSPKYLHIVNNVPNLTEFRFVNQFDRYNDLSDAKVFCIYSVNSTKLGSYSTSIKGIVPCNLSFEIYQLDNSGNFNFIKSVVPNPNNGYFYSNLRNLFDYSFQKDNTYRLTVRNGNATKHKYFKINYCGDSPPPPQPVSSTNLMDWIVNPGDSGVVLLSHSEVSLRPNFSWENYGNEANEKYFKIVEVNPTSSVSNLLDIANKLFEKKPVFEIVTEKNELEYPKELSELKKGSYYFWIVYETDEKITNIHKAGLFKAGSTTLGKVIMNCIGCAKECANGRCWQIGDKCFCF